MSWRKKNRESLHETIKPYIQFSKKVISFCIINLIVIEVFVMFMIFTTKDTSVLPYLITSLAVQFLGCVIWYLKNSEAEKKVRIEAEIERMKLVSENSSECKIIEHTNDVENPPDTFYQGNDDSGEVVTDVSLPVNPAGSTYYDDGSVG